MALATLTDLENLLGPLPPARAVAAQTLLAGYQAELESLTNRALTNRAIVGEIAPVVDGYALLAHGPVFGLPSEVRYLPPSGDTVYEGERTVVAGRIYFEGLVGAVESFVFDYTTGVEPGTTHPLKSVLVARVARMLAKVADDAAGLSALTQEGYSSSYLDEGWTEQEMAVITKFRRPVMA